MTIKDGGPAFPQHGFDTVAERFTSQGGMTLRDYFAGLALMGVMASRNPTSPRFYPEDDAAYVYAVADAMLKAREAE
jgi:hypothetical protein